MSRDDRRFVQAALALVVAGVCWTLPIHAQTASHATKALPLAEVPTLAPAAPSPPAPPVSLPGLVTVAQFRACLEDVACQDPLEWPPAKARALPKTNPIWAPYQDAIDFARWKGARLPRIAELETACRAALLPPADPGPEWAAPASTDDPPALVECVLQDGKAVPSVRAAGFPAIFSRFRAIPDGEPKR